MTPQPHIIRLRDPWQWVVADGSAAAACAAAGISANRWFNRPTGLQASTRVVLIIDGITSLRSVRLNDQTLVDTQPADSIWECDVSERLALRNQIRLDIQSLGSADADNDLRKQLSGGNVRLEIYEPHTGALRHRLGFYRPAGPGC